MLDKIEVIGSKGITLCRAKWINCNFSLKCHYRDCKILPTWIKTIWLKVCSENVAWPEAHNTEKEVLVAGGPDTRKERVILDSLQVARFELLERRHMWTKVRCTMGWGRQWPSERNRLGRKKNRSFHMLNNSKKGSLYMLGSRPVKHQHIVCSYVLFEANVLNWWMDGWMAQNYIAAHD